MVLSTLSDLRARKTRSTRKILAPPPVNVPGPKVKGAIISVKLVATIVRSEKLKKLDEHNSLRRQ